MNRKKLPANARCDEHPSKPVYARGKCYNCYQKHYMRRYSSLDGEERMESLPRLRHVNKGKTCHYCNRLATHRGLCKYHYNKFYRRGMLELNRITTIMDIDAKGGLVLGIPKRLVEG